MSHLAELAQRVASLLREHFQIENEPPPPCPNSIGGWVNLLTTLGKLRNTLPEEGNFSSRDSVEIYHHEIVERLRTVTDELTAHFYDRFDGSHVGGLATIPPVPQQTFISVCWAAQRLRELDASPEPATITNNAEKRKRTRRKPGELNGAMLNTLQSNRDSRGWDCNDWAKALKCLPSQVVIQPAWKELEEFRRIQKIERQKDRRGRGVTK